jgi:hypothetical protein
MKTRKITLFTLSAIAGVLASITDVVAQSRLQIIHNSAAVSLDTVDVYVDDTKIENVNFRRATGLLTLSAGSHTINVNDRNSLDSGDMVLARFAVSLVNSQSHIAIINGVDMPSNYVANPDGRSTDVQLTFRSNTVLSPSNSAQTALNIVHGVTDAPGVDIFVRPNTLLLNSVRYGEVSANTFASSVSTLIDVRDSNGLNVINTYIAPLQAFAKKSLVVFASGFIDVSNNQNGKAFGLYAVDTNGGDAIALSSTARIQFVHNSPDYIIDTVDVWANDVKIVNDLPFRKATAMLNIAQGTYDITVTKKFSIDTSAAVTLFKQSSYLVESGKTYLAFINGVVDTTQYATNPSGIDRSFKIVASNSYKEGGTPGQVELSFANGTPDAPALDLNEIGLPGLNKIGNDIAYGMVSPSLSLGAGNTLFNVTSADSTIFKAAYKLNTTAFSGRTGVVFTSGVNEAIGNPTPAKSFGLYVLFSEGSVVELSMLNSEVQIVHNSADVTLDTVDVYVNNVLTLDNFAFRHATPFVNLKAYIPQVVAIAPKGSNSSAEAVFTKSLLLDSSTLYYAVASGVLNPSNYVVNPDGKTIGFELYTFKGARKTATASKNVDLLYFHGATDLRKTTIKGSGQVQYLSKNDSYGGFHGYGIHTALDNVLMEVTDANNIDSVLYTGFANLASHQGGAGLVFASGFAKANSVTNQNGDTLVLFVVWPDGDVDSIAPPKPITGIEEQSVLNQSSLSVFPNPSSTNATITVQAITNTSSTITLVDIAGRTIYTDSWKMSAGVNTYELDLVNLTSGLYFLKITTSDLQQLTHKIIVSK